MNFFGDIEFIKKLFNTKIKKIIRISVTLKYFLEVSFKQLLTFAAYESFFIFDGKYYTQIDGVAMGFPLGLALAKTFLCHFEKSGFQNAL